jgi:hypothetical protein
MLIAARSGAPKHILETRDIPHSGSSGTENSLKESGIFKPPVSDGRSQLLDQRCSTVDMNVNNWVHSLPNSPVPSLGWQFCLWDAMECHRQRRLGAAFLLLPN